MAGEIICQLTSGNLPPAVASLCGHGENLFSFSQCPLYNQAGYLYNAVIG